MRQKWLLVGLSWYREQAIRGEWLAAVVLLLHLLNGDALKIALEYLYYHLKGVRIVDDRLNSQVGLVCACKTRETSTHVGRRVEWHSFAYHKHRHISDV